MISTELCLYEIDLELNKLSSFDSQSIPVEDKLIALNNAQVEAVLSKVDINNMYHIGLDGFRRRYEDLQILIVPHKSIPATTSDLTDKYISDLTKLPSKYLLPVEIFITADKSPCIGRSLSVNIIPHSDLHIRLNNTNYRPSFEWQETIATISNNTLEIWTDGTFTPTASFVSYLTYPVPFDYPGYINLDNQESVLSDSNLPEYMKNEIISIAVRQLAANTANQLVYQTAVQDQVKNN